MKLPAAGLSWLETALNHYIALDPEFPPRLDVVAGKSFKLEITGMEFDIYVAIGHRYIKLHAFPETEPQLIVRGTPLELLNLLRTEDPMAAVQSGNVELFGDVQLARELKKLFAALDIDWEEMAARVIGDWPAHQLSMFTRGVFSWRSRSRQSVEQTIGEYLQEESRLLPARIEVENFIAAVDSIREAVDRLEAGINHGKAGRS